jgi:hypothetical protein
MVVKCKDGTPYCYQKPNPIMSLQYSWDCKYILHNKLGHTVIFPDQAQPEKPEEPEINDDKSEVAEESTDEVQILTSLPGEHETPDPNKIEAWCLPAVFKEFKDSFYGEKYRKIQYGSKFLLEAILIKLEDLYIKLWINTKSVTKGSILYPRIQDRRWWRVEHIEQIDNGYLITGSLSDYQPNFSD